MSGSTGHRIFTTTLASVYPLYLAKVERKGRTRDELDAVIRWLTGYDQSELDQHLAAGTTFADFFAGARLHPNAALITGVDLRGACRDDRGPAHAADPVPRQAGGRAREGSGAGEGPAQLMAFANAQDGPSAPPMVHILVSHRRS